MSNQSSDDNNLLNFIATTVETMREQMATKDDLDTLRSQMATKDDLARMATKDDVEALREQVAFIGGQVETVRDQMATKNDLARLEDRLWLSGFLRGTPQHIASALPSRFGK